MNWIILTVLAICSRAVYGIFTKVLSSNVKVSAITHSLLLTTFAGLLSFLVMPFTGGLSFAGAHNYIIPALIMVFSSSFGNILYFIGIKKLDAGITQIAFSSILIWGAALSYVFLKSAFSLNQLIGITLMFIAILLIQYQNSKFELNRSVLYIIASSLLFAVFQVSSAELSQNINTGAYLLMAYFGPSLVIAAFYSGKIRQDLPKISIQLSQTFKTTILTSGFTMLYFVFSYLAYKTAPDRGVVVVLLPSQVILAVLLGIIFLNEKQSIAKKLLAGVLALVAGVLIKS